jgi:hypothetical protein
MTISGTRIATLSLLTLSGACSGSVAATSTVDSGAGNDAGAHVDASGPSDASAPSDAHEAAAPSDAGAHDTGTPSDAHPQGDADAAGGPAALATFDDTSGAATLYGITGDGYLIYADGSSTVHAVSLSGGTPIQLAQIGSSLAWVTVQNNVALIMPSPDANGIGPLVVWSAAGGLHQLSAASTTALNWSVSADSTHVLYFDHAAAQADSGTGAVDGDLYVANADGSGVTLLREGISQYWDNQAPCYYNFSFAGSYAVLWQCTPAASGQNVTAWTFPEQGWQPIQLPGYLSGNGYGFDVDKSGTLLLLETAAGLQLYPLAGGSPTTIDSAGAWGVFTSDGSTLLYTTTAGVLNRVQVAHPSPPQQLVPGSVHGLAGLSPDGQHVLVFDHEAPVGPIDLYLASAVSPSTPVALVPTTTAEVGMVMSGDPFTTDSSHAIFFSNMDTSTWLGTLMAGPTSGSGNPVQLATNSNAAWAVGPSGVVFSTQVSSGTFAIGWADTSQAAPPTTLVPNALGTGFLVTPARDRIVYIAPSGVGSGASIFTRAVP